MLVLTLDNGLVQSGSTIVNSVVSKRCLCVNYAAKARRPGEGSLNDPATRQEDKAPFGLMMFNDFQFNSMLGGGLDRIGARVTLVDEDDLHALTGGLLHALDKSVTCARSCLLAGVTFNANKCPGGSTAA